MCNQMGQIALGLQVLLMNIQFPFHNAAISVIFDITSNLPLTTSDEQIRTNVTKAKDKAETEANPPIPTILKAEYENWNKNF